jgi:hypothetical protein
MKHERLRFFRDLEGAPRAEAGDPDGRVLALFLESDLQDDAGLCRELLGRMTSRRGANDQPINFIGNSFAMTVDADIVTLSGHSEGNSHTAMLDSRRVETAVRGWLEFIEA